MIKKPIKILLEYISLRKTNKHISDISKEKEAEIEKKGYISLRKASQYCEYSQDYLSLRARQGKLKAVKFDKIWVTKKEWLEEYLRRVEEYKNGFSKSAERRKFIFTNLPYQSVPSRAIVVAGALIIILFSALTLSSHPSFEGIKEVAFLKTKFISDKSSEFFYNLHSDIKDNFVGYISYTGDATKNVIENARNVKREIEKEIKEKTYSISKSLSKKAFDTSLLKDSAKKRIELSFGEIKNKVFCLVKRVRDFNKNIVYFLTKEVPNKIIAIFDKEKEDERAQKEILPKPERKGLVVIPSTGDDEKIKEKIKFSFSDEVKVFPEDESSGIIVPVFREREGNKYLYILVPMRE